MAFFSNKINKWLLIIFLIILVVCILMYIKPQNTINGFEAHRRNAEQSEGERMNSVNHVDGIDAIYWINLDRSQERRIEMEKMLSSVVFKNIPNHRISAIDGKNPNNVHTKLGNYKKQDGVTDYEYACLMSHLDAINDFYQSKYNVVLIMEDDVTLEFHKYWRKSISRIIDNAPPDWEIIMLSYNVESNGFKTNEYHKYSGEYSTVSYLINKKGALKLINSIYRNNKYNLLDNHRHVADGYLYEFLKTYVYKYPLFISKTNNDSVIHTDHVQYHDRNKEYAIIEYEKMV